MRLVCLQHQQNFRLWHQEDIARTPNANSADLAAVKRAIDKLNQQRNDLIERLDDALLAALSAARVQVRPERAAQHRNARQRHRPAVDSGIASLPHGGTGRAERRRRVHVAKAKVRLEVLREQQRDLLTSLGELLDDIFAGRKRLKVYRQFKMYNDPTMNPYLYAAKRPAA